MPVDAAKAICGRDSRLLWLRTELTRQFQKPGIDFVTTQEILGWFLRYGDSLGFSRDELLSCLNHDEALLRAAEGLEPTEIAAGKPPPDFLPGQSVEVVLNGRNTTYRRGAIGEVLWHIKEGLWHYRLVENGKRIAKRYEARDLRATESLPGLQPTGSTSAVQGSGLVQTTTAAKLSPCPSSASTTSASNTLADKPR